MEFGIAYFPTHDAVGPGTLAQLVEQKLAEVGCERAVHWLPSTPISQLEGELEKWERAVAEFTGNQ
jgi:hypothetical protein